MAYQFHGCLFHPAGVSCGDKSKCSVCGWTPEEEARRKALRAAMQTVERLKAMQTSKKRPRLLEPTKSRKRK